MKKRIFWAAAVIGAVAETAAVIYTLHTRDKLAFGGELFMLPLFIMAAYCITEIRDMVQDMEKPCKRIMTETKSRNTGEKSETNVLDKETIFDHEEDQQL